MTIYKGLKFGADPEFFAGYMKDGELNVLPPVILRMKHGAKFEENGRHPIFAKYGDTLFHEDGAAFEVSTPPSSDWRDVWTTIHETKHRFSDEVLSQYSDVCESELFSLPAMKWDVYKWAEEGPEFEMATLFGCDADQDVYNMKAACRVIDARFHPWRYAGGHIHVSGIEEVETQPLLAIRSMVLTAGLACTAYTDVPELEKERLFLYGRPGKFRIQNYPNGEHGIEYRTPSTRWTSDMGLADKIFSWAEIGMKELLQNGLLKSFSKSFEKEATSAILGVNQALAKELLSAIEDKL